MSDADRTTDVDPVRDRRLPSTTAWAIAVAAAVGVLALAAFDLRVAAGAGVGLVLAAAMPGFDGSNRRIVATATVLPVAALGVAATLGTAGGPVDGALVLLGTVVALAAGLLLAGGLEPSTIKRAAAAAVTAGIASGAVALAADSVSQLGRETILETVLWLTVSGLRETVLALVVAGIAAGAAVVALPPAALATPTARDAYDRARRGLLGWIAVAVVVAVAALVGATVLSWFVPALEAAVAALVDGPVVRGACAVVTTVSVAVAAVGIAVRYAWIAAAERTRESAAVSVLVGSILGAIAPLPLALAVDEPTAVVTAAGGGAAGVLLAGGTGAAAYAQWRAASGSRLGSGPGPSWIVVAAALGAGAVVVGTTVRTAAGLAALKTGAVSIVALAAGLFVYDVGRYGRVLARDVGVEPEAAPRPQYVRIGWSALVAGVGSVVAVLGLAVTTLFAPTLSVPATTAVLAAVAAVVAGAWLLFR
ncbi:hypothetical protein [Halopiger thermotolerans]